MRTHASFKRLIVLILAPLIIACGSPQAQVVRETVIVNQTSAPVVQTVIVEATSDTETDTAQTEPTAAPNPGGKLTQLNPTLGDVRVRQAIAYCIDRLEIAKARYPFLSDDERQALMIDSFVPSNHWAYSDDITKYPFDPAQGIALLEEAGWQSSGPGVRYREDGTPLSIKFLSADTPTSQNIGAVMEQQLINNCGIQIIRTHAPGSYFLGARTGVQVRDFELTSFSWVGQPDPSGSTLYACNQIPTPENNWEGQNFMGWCNQTASNAILAANNTLVRDERAKQFAIFQKEFTKDMVSLPLYQIFDVVAAGNNVENFKADATQTIFGNAGEWSLKDGSDNLIIAINSEPDTLWGLISAEITTSDILAFLLGDGITSYNYDYQAPGSLTRLPSLENGGATNTEVEVTAGDTVWTTAGEAAELAPGVEVVDSTGNTITYESGTIKMNQLAVTFETIPGLKWEDGEPVVKADYELALKINCDPESGSVSLTLCESRASVDFASDTTYTITYHPGAQWANYSVYGLGSYPSHQVLSDGRKLADVPVNEWASLPEIAEMPLSTGPYKLVEWVKGQKLVFEANPNYYKGEVPIKTLTLQVIPDTTQAVAQLMTGSVDIIDYAGTGTEQESVINAGKEGKLQVITFPSATWAHLDMNLYLP
jgi:ABC-type transport system substrate-binding protein